MEQTVEADRESILAKLMANTDLWDFSDPEAQKEIIELILDAEVKVKQVPLRVEQAKQEAAVTSARSMVDTSKVDAEARVEIARIQAAGEVKRSGAPYRWRTHMVWAVAAVVVAAMIVAEHSGTIAMMLVYMIPSAG
jgi:hypothetical protein